MSPQPLVEAAAEVRDTCQDLKDHLETKHVTHVYNPLAYAWDVHEDYIRTYGDDHPREAVLVGMNPGPWGMVQTGVPFSDPRIARDWLGLTGHVGEPDVLHPDRPVTGFASERNERSGERVFSLARDAFGGFDTFFDRFWLANHCPLAFFDADGSNRTPPKLWKADREALFRPCDAHVRTTVEVLEPDVVVGIGKFAERRARAALQDLDVTVGGVLHPSPANPQANQGWAKQALKQLAELGIEP